MCRSMVDIHSAVAEIRRGKKEDRNYRMKIYMVSLLHRATINSKFKEIAFVCILIFLYFIALVFLCLTVSKGRVQRSFDPVCPANLNSSNFVHVCIT